MHLNDEGIGRAIYANTSTPPEPPKEFRAKEEPAAGQMASDLHRLGVAGLQVSSSAGVRMLFSRDQSEIPRFLKTIMFRSTPDLVVQALSVEAVSAVLKYANARGIAVIPRGSGSSPFGGSVPVAGGIVLDVSPMDKVLGIDASNQTITVQAGARWADIDHFLYGFGLCLSTSPSSRFSTVGGWVATGGVGLIHQYGSPDLPVGTKFAVNYGGGLKFPRLVGPLGLRFDARGYTAVDTSGSSLNMLEVTAGVLLSIGR